MISEIPRQTTTLLDDELHDKDGQHHHATKGRLVFAVLPKPGRRVNTLSAAVRREPRKHSRYMTRIIAIFGECLAQVPLFACDYRHVNQREHQYHDRDHLPTDLGLSARQVDVRG